MSDAGTYARLPADHSDEDQVILASSRPKKRAGRRIFNETRHPVYRGVRKRNKNKWVCEVREPNKKSRIWLGTYPTPEMAARAHDVAVLALRGRSACLNFADSTWRVRLPASKDAKEIRRAAAEAAEVLRPREFGGGVCGGENLGDNCDVTRKEISVKDCDDHEVVGSDTGNRRVEEEAVKDCDDHKVVESTGSGTVEEEAVKGMQENVFYVDEEAVFDMPGLLVNMAEGLLISPPSYVGDGIIWEDMETDADMSLWSFSI